MEIQHDQFSSHNDNDNDNDDDDDDIKTIICYNIDPELAKVLGINTNINIKELEKTQGKWLPPVAYRLSNSEPIINKFKLNKEDYKSSFDYFTLIKDDISNFRKLTKEQLEYIKNMTSEQKQIVIELLNICYGELITLVK